MLRSDTWDSWLDVTLRGRGERKIGQIPVEVCRGVESGSKKRLKERIRNILRMRGRRRYHDAVLLVQSHGSEIIDAGGHHYQPSPPSVDKWTGTSTNECSSLLVAIVRLNGILSLSPAGLWRDRHRQQPLEYSSPGIRTSTHRIREYLLQAWVVPRH